jgi:cytochrome c oxidase subunit 2
MRQRSTRRRFAFTALVALALLAAGCDGVSGPHNGQNPLHPKASVAHKVDNLFVPVVITAIVIGILIFGAVVFAAIRYRARPGNENPKQIHGNTALEIGWTLIPAVILAVIAVPTVSLIFDLAKKPDAGALEVTVVAKQWWWQFDYAAQDGNKKVVVADELHVPTGRQIHVNLRACDDSLPGGCNVIHSFWVPELAGKKDVVPGRDNDMTFTADEPGTYLGQCAEFCGLSHANMRFRVIAQKPGDFQSWIEGQQGGPAVALEDAGSAGKLFSTKFGCSNCHTTDSSKIATYGPNLTHLASRTTFASGYYELNRKNLIAWILDAPSLIPMESKDCRKGLGVPGVTCVGMPSFTKNTPQGQPTMTDDQAATIADYLLELK